MPSSRPLQPHLKQRACPLQGDSRGRDSHVPSHPWAAAEGLGISHGTAQGPLGHQPASTSSCPPFLGFPQSTPRAAVPGGRSAGCCGKEGGRPASSVGRAPPGWLPVRPTTRAQTALVVPRSAEKRSPFPQRHVISLGRRGGDPETERAVWLRQTEEKPPASCFPPSKHTTPRPYHSHVHGLPPKKKASRPDIRRLALTSW